MKEFDINSLLPEEVRRLLPKVDEDGNLPFAATTFVDSEPRACQALFALTGNTPWFFSDETTLAEVGASPDWEPFVDNARALFPWLRDVHLEWMCYLPLPEVITRLRALQPGWPEQGEQISKLTNRRPSP